MNKYHYTGPIYFYGNKIAEYSDIYTMAPSFSKARNNFLFKVANGDNILRYDIVDNFINKVEKPVIDKITPVLHCDKCGMELNPLGECPVCDYGEYDLLDDEV